MYRRVTYQEDYTLREFQVLNLLSEGKTRKSIGFALSISPHTVKDHTDSIYKKMGAHSRYEAVAFAFMDGLVH